MRDLLEGVASATVVTVTGVFQRHTSPKVRALIGSAAGGRWGPSRAYPILNLGRPSDSVAVEAYRHLVDSVMDDGMTGDLVGPRNLITCEVEIGRILDLRKPENLTKVGLTPADLVTDVGDYSRCQRVGRAAHQLELAGILAPAATGLGETLAIFEHHRVDSDTLRVLSVETWQTLPADPRRRAREANP